MGVNYLIVIIVVIAVAGLIIWLIKRNVHDEKKIEGNGNPLGKDPDKTMEEL